VVVVVGLLDLKLYSNSIILCLCFHLRKFNRIHIDEVGF
jgi:hypothetical protein